MLYEKDGVRKQKNENEINERNRREERVPLKRKNEYRLDYFIIYGIIIILSAICIGIFFGDRIKRMVKDPSAVNMEMIPKTVFSSAETEKSWVTSEEPESFIDFSGNHLYSQEIFLMKRDTKEILYEKNGDAIIYPASMTKIMTAMITMDLVMDISELIEVKDYYLAGLLEENASVAGFLAGEIVSVEDLLYGLMLPSGGDAAKILAIDLSGSEAIFVDIMNEKAKELGLTKTKFSNVTGLHNKEHVSTVEEWAIILDRALENETLKKMMMTKRHTMAPTNKHPLGFTVFHTMFESVVDISISIGGKTGYTEKAGLCLASFSEIHGEEYILISAGAQGNPKISPLHVMDAENIYKNLLP